MITSGLRAKYQATIGIECHVQLKTKTKLFSGASNDARQAAPNTLINHIDFGLPGALPVLNEEAVRLACKAAFALDTVPQSFSKFDRKHYFYPDLPMGYQITQYEQPIILGGQVTFNLPSGHKVVGITRAHLEADAGKSVHPTGQNYSLVDLNRAGTPLLEIVSEPDMNTAQEAKAYTRELFLLMKYADVSDANLYYGNMRFDVNVSVSMTSALGTRTETKNLNSFRAVEKAVDYEIERQIEQLEKGGSVVQETRGWNDAKQKTFSQRTKENADDYRYFPDPDLPPVVLTDDYISRVKTEMGRLPKDWRKILTGLDLATSDVELVIEAQADYPDCKYNFLIEKALDDKTYADQLMKWLVNIDIPSRRLAEKDSGVDRSTLYRGVWELQRNGKLSSTNVRQLILSLLKSNKLPPSFEEYADREGLIQVSDNKELEKLVEMTIMANPKAVTDIKNGEQKAIGYLVGQIMIQSKGKANPKLVQEIIQRKI